MDIDSVVMFHGFGMYGELYRERASMMFPGLPLYLPDLPGHGLLEGQLLPNAINAVCARYATRLAQNGERRTLVIAESMGCAVVKSLETAIESHYGEVAGIVLLSPPVTFQWTRIPTWSFPTTPVLIKRGVFPGLLIDVSRPMGRLVGDPQIRRQVLNDPLVKTHVTTTYLATSLSLIASVPAVLKKLEVPVIAIQGGRDPLLGGRASEITATMVSSKKARHEVIEGARHCLFWDSQFLRTIQLVRQWTLSLPSKRE